MPSTSDTTVPHDPCRPPLLGIVGGAPARSVQVPTQERLNELMRRAQEVADEAASLLGAKNQSAQLLIFNADADIYHALPHRPTGSRTGGGQWKQVVQGPFLSHISVWCNHEESCPDRQPQPDGAA